MKKALLIDLQNIYIGLRDRHGREVSVPEIIAAAGGWGELVEARAYADFSTLPVGLRLELYGTGISCRHVQCSRNGQRNGAAYEERLKNEVDLHLSSDLVELAVGHGDIDTLVIATGDSDFIPGLTKARQYGKRTEVIAVPGSLSEALKNFIGEEPAFLKGGRPIRSVALAA